MATIKDLLIEIENFQKEILEVDYDDDFQSGIVNLTSVIYFDHLSHSVLDLAKNIDLSSIPISKKYYKLYSTPFLLRETIRINTIGYFFNIWMEYERFLRRKSSYFFGHEKFKISSLFDEILELVEESEKWKIKNEFEVLRNTRNSLHDGGVYKHDKPYKGKIGHQTYIFVKNNPVIPIRNVDAIRVVWNHFLIINSIKITSQSSS